MTDLKNIRVYLINPETKTVEEALIAPELESYYACMDCSLIDIVYLDHTTEDGSTVPVMVIVDDEGLLKSNALFEVKANNPYPIVLAGKSILVGEDENGDISGCSLSLTEAKELIAWTDKADIT